MLFGVYLKPVKVVAQGVVNYLYERCHDVNIAVKLIKFLCSVFTYQRLKILDVLKHLTKPVTQINR